MSLSPELALLLGVASGMSYLLLSTQLAARYARRQLRGAALPRQWLHGRGSWLDIAVWVLAIVGAFVIWLAVALNDQHPTATRIIGALHTVVAIGWTAYLTLVVLRRPRSELG